MQAQRPVVSDPRLRAFAVLLICALALALGTVARGEHSASHAGHHGAVLTAAAADTPASLHRTQAHGDLVAPPAVRTAPVRPVATSDSSSSANSRTAESSLGRGPPVQALA